MKGLNRSLRSHFARRILQAGAGQTKAPEAAHPDKAPQREEAWWPAVELNWQHGKEGRTGRERKLAAKVWKLYLRLPSVDLVF